MKRLYTTLIVCLTALTIGQAQEMLNSNYKQWHKNLTKPKLDTVRIGALINLSEYHLEKSYEVTAPRSLDSAMYYAQQAVAFSEQLNNQYLLGMSYLRTSKAQARKGQPKLAQDYASKAVTIFTNGTNKTELAKAYLALASAKGVSNIDEVNVLNEKARQLYKQIGNHREEAKVLTNIAYLHMGQGKMQLGQDELKECLVLYKNAGDKNVQRVYSLIGISYNELGNYQEALSYGLTAVRLAEEFDPNGYSTAEIYNYLAKTYLAIKNSEKAMEYLQKAYVISEKFKTTGLSILIENNLVKLLMDQNRNREALLILKKMEQYQNLNPNSKAFVVGRSLTTYTRLKEFKKADTYVKQSLEILESNKPMDYINTLLYPPLIAYYWSAKDYEQAKKYANIYKSINEKNKNLKDLSETHRMLFRLDSVEQKFDSAVKHLQLEKAYNDSLFSETTNKQLAEMQVKYESEKKDKNLIIKEQANQVLVKQAQLNNIKLLQEKKLKDYSFAGVALLIIILALLYNRYRIKKKANDEINKKNALLGKLVDEKEWLLKEVHHRVKNNLQMVISLLNTQSNFLKDHIALDAIRESQNRIQAMSLIHKRLYQSNNIVAINMKTYIEELIEYFKVSYNTGKNIRFELAVEPIELDSALAIPISLIMNEVITNAVKHAFPENKSGNIIIGMNETAPDYFTLRIKDNGIGFPTNIPIKESSSMGMNLIYGLSEDLEAEVETITDHGAETILKFRGSGNKIIALSKETRESA